MNDDVISVGAVPGTGPTTKWDSLIKETFKGIIYAELNRAFAKEVTFEEAIDSIAGQLTKGFRDGSPDRLAAKSAKTKPEALTVVVEAIRPILGPFDRIVLAVDDEATGGIVLATVTSDGTERIDVVHTPDDRGSGSVLLRALGITARENGGGTQDKCSLVTEELEIDGVKRWIHFWT